MKTHGHVIAHFMLSLACLCMLAVPVIPHHHHADGTLCMKNDIGQQAKHCCHDSGCMAASFIRQAPTTTNDTWMHPVLQPVPNPVLLTPARIPTCVLRTHKPPLTEALYDRYLARATGLRAPPFLV